MITYYELLRDECGLHIILVEEGGDEHQGVWLGHLRHENESFSCSLIEVTVGWRLIAGRNFVQRWIDANTTE